MVRIFIVIGVVLAVANILCARAIFSDSDESSVYFLNIGQGDAELVAHRGIHMLIDAGRDGKTSIELERVLEDKKYIDVVLLTHADSDHAGGIYQVLDRFSVGVLLVGNGYHETWEEVLDYAKQKGVAVYKLDMHDRITHKDVTATVLWPDPLYNAKTDNEKSIVLKYKHTDYAVLFAGDISERVEDIIVSLFDIDADILKVPHHGSKYSSSMLFVREVSPLLSVIEVGTNSYGHPTPETLSRLSSVGSHILRTDEQGTVRVYTENGSVRVQKIDQGSTSLNVSEVEP